MRPTTSVSRPPRATGPVQERFYAQYAGLGWVGKHTCLISLSYLTIELKGRIPEDVRPGLGAQVFGCDVCQDVCPWNALPAVSRPKLRGLRRNLAVVLGNSGDGEAIRALAQDRRDASILDPLVASHVSWAREGAAAPSAAGME